MKIFSILYIAAVTSTAFAQEAPATSPDVVNLPTIQVLSERQEEVLKTPGAVTVVTQDELKKNKPTSAQDAVKRTAGANVIEAEGVAYIGMRGLSPDGSRKVLLLEDGAPLALGPYIDSSAYYAPIVERMERIDIRKGSSSLAFGPSTIGGVINYLTKNPTKDHGNAVTLTGGSRDYKALLIEGSSVKDGTGLLLNIFAKDGNGSRDNSHFKTQDVLVKYGGALSDKSYIGIKLSHYKSEAQLTYLGLTQKLYEEDPYQNPAKDDILYINRYEMNLTHDYQINGDSRLATLFYVNQTARDWWRQNFSKDGAGNISMTAGNKGRNRTFDVAGIDSRYFLNWNAGEVTNDLQVGLRLHTEDMRNVEVKGATSTSRSGVIDTDDKRFADAQTLYAENAFNLERWTITPGVRIESYRQSRMIYRKSSADFNQGSATRNTEYLGGMGAAYELTKQEFLFAGVHQGFAPPRVQDSIDNNGQAVDLSAERSVNVELGYRSQRDNFQMEAALFQLDFSNQLIQATESGGASSTLTNGGKTLHQGLELSTRYSPEFDRSLIIDVNATYLPVAKFNSTRIISSEDRNGNRLPYAPEYMFNAALGYKRQAWFTQLQYAFVSEQYADAENTVEGSVDGMRGVLPAYGLFHLTGEYQATRDLTLELSVRNLADTTYIASRAPQGIFPGMRRTAFLGLKTEF
ncbi:TonB-dependent receptor [Bdellovibrio bacteriovorus]|uniref:Outer membrane iron(III) dicitrate receptor n=1 Tax=Bdellovibrio bacteriovorus (strain ATCC 15356 / DSM 50701 / NCIMB 9529 / HD100) TaxID=264462 RepID=Q6MJW8_BDEBA|nr:TonB-dependent receptor [Bdellovibrio bacteriovorus]CAE80441.1 outer membrane iron(III) dicitrate receptor [Bdellovibrio bacteriovorus HD100]